MRLHSDPSCWPAGLLIVIGLTTGLPPPMLAISGHNLVALLWAVASIAVWWWMGSRTSPGFPLVFDGVATLTLFLTLGTVLVVTVRWLWTFLQ